MLVSEIGYFYIPTNQTYPYFNNKKNPFLTYDLAEQVSIRNVSLNDILKRINNLLTA